MVDKRGLDGSSNGDAAAPDAKRAKVDGEPAAAAAPGSKQLASLEAIQKAKKLLEQQKQLKEKMKKLSQLTKPGATAAPAAAAAAAAPPAAAISAAQQRAIEAAARLGLQATIATAAPLAATAAPVPVAPGAGAAPRPTGPVSGQRAGFKPAPLLLDAQGREVDEKGQVIAKPVQAVTTLKVNQRLLEEEARRAAEAEALQRAAEAEAALAAKEASFHDPRMEDLALRRLARPRRAGFDFVQEGSLQKAAENARLEAAFGEMLKKRRRMPAGPEGPPQPQLAANLVPIGQKAEGAAEEAAPEADTDPLATEPVPDVEWWDKPLLVSGRYDSTAKGTDDAPAAVNADDGADGSVSPSTTTAAANGTGSDTPAGTAAAAAGRGASGGGEASAAAANGPAAPGNFVLKANKITLYVEHPVPIAPPAEAPPPPPQPLKLTTRELKKLRKQRREAREKEKQQLIRQGLLEPPKPKVKISNLMRVLGEQAVLDPTAIEKEVRSQMAERQSAHDDRNLARALLPAERREKKMRKLFDDSGIETVTCVYKVSDLSHGAHRFKVDVNAKENHMSGVMLIADAFSLVVVEGCNKSIKRYNKLMLRRINWAEVAEAAAEHEEDAGEAAAMDVDGEREAGAKEPGSCYLVWQGVVKEAAFSDFAKHEVHSSEAARKLLEDAGVAHYWDAAANFRPEDAPPVVL